MLWGGRFESLPTEAMRRLNDSFAFDRRLYAADIEASIAYARALARIGLIASEELLQITAGLEQVRAEFDAGTFRAQPDDEDIHTAIERRLGELIGPLAGKLHTGRSRNDQVTTDLRLYLLDEIDALHQKLAELQMTLIERAEASLEFIMPGYTHLQPAQPVLFSHWLMSYFWKFQRDRQRLTQIATRVAVLPLGAGALAGHPFGLDRRALAVELGFSAVAENSMDAVSDRDYAVEFLAWAALLQVHLSNLAEDLILWASHEFGFVEIAEAYSSGSSLMPQKKNPDSLELIRGKTGRVIGHLTGLLITLKALPSTYNKDLQEDKEATFDVIDTLHLELPVITGVIRTLKVNAARMAEALDDALLASDLCDYLVRKGVPFRQSHYWVGQVVRRAAQQGVSLRELPLVEYQAIHPAFADDLTTVLDFQRSVAARDTEGGTAPSALRAQIERARQVMIQTNSNR